MAANIRKHPSSKRISSGMLNTCQLNALHNCIVVVPAGNNPNTSLTAGWGDRFEHFSEHACAQHGAWWMQVGVGAFVMNSKREVLVVQERFGPLKGSVSRRLRPCSDSTLQTPYSTLQTLYFHLPPRYVAGSIPTCLPVISACA